MAKARIGATALVLKMRGMELEKAAKQIEILRQPNFGLRLGEEDFGLAFHFRVQKTRLNRLKWWLLTHIFPFKIEYWKDD